MASQYSSKAALLGSCIDYAGTFPPAKLPLEEALVEAAAFRSEAKHPWLLSRMALPVKDLKTITGARLLQSGASGAPWIFTALGAATTVEEIEKEVETILLMNEKADGQSCRWLIRSYETKLLSDVVSQKEVDEIQKLSKQTLEYFSSGAVNPYFEVAFVGNWAEGLETFCEVLAEVKSKRHLRPGIKIRTGGKVVPTTEQISRVLGLCAKYGLRFKATQGLHHAISQEKEFGFVNLFAALNFAHVLGPDSFGKAVVQRCLEEKDAKNFKFGKDSFSWGEFNISSAEIESARERHMGCFGSCSLHEPDSFLSSEMES